MHPEKLLASYGRRKGRKLRPSKQGLMDTLLPKLELTLEELGNNGVMGLWSKNPHNSTTPLLPHSIWLEIGFGAGEHLAHQASLHPDIGIIGCEPYINGTAVLLSHIETNKLNNIRIYAHDARFLIEKLPDASIDRVFILYPDPWPKARHNKRRLVSEKFLGEIARILKQAGELRLATDHEGYCTWMLERLLPNPNFTWLAKTAEDWLNPPPDWIPTRYEQKALAGRPTYLNFVRN